MIFHLWFVCFEFLRNIYFSYPPQDSPYAEAPPQDTPAGYLARTPCPGPPSTGPPKISLLFFLLPPKISLFVLSLGVFSLKLVVFLKAGELQNARLGSLGHRVKPRRPHQTGPPGAHDDPENSKRAPKFHGKTPRESTKSVISGGKRKKKRIFGPSTLLGATLRGPTIQALPTLWAPTFSRFGPPPFWAPPCGPQLLLGLPTRCPFGSLCRCFCCCFCGCFWVADR